MKTSYRVSNKRVVSNESSRIKMLYQNSFLKDDYQFLAINERLLNSVSLKTEGQCNVLILTPPNQPYLTIPNRRRCYTEIPF